MPNVIVDRRLFLNADKTRLVDPDDPDAAFLWANTGDEVTEDAAAEAGYKAAPKSADKAVAAPDEDKAEAPESDKAPEPEPAPQPKPAKRATKKG